MKNDQTIRDALGMAARLAGSNAALGRQLKIHGATLGKYRNELITEITDEHWEKLYNAICQWLPRSPAYWPRSRLQRDWEGHLSEAQYSPAQSQDQAGQDTPPPCTGKPPWLAELCRHWDELSEEMKGVLEDTAKRALKKWTPATNRRRAKAG